MRPDNKSESFKFHKNVFTSHSSSRFQNCRLKLQDRFEQKKDNSSGKNDRSVLSVLSLNDTRKAIRNSADKLSRKLSNVRITLGNFSQVRLGLGARRCSREMRVCRGSSRRPRGAKSWRKVPWRPAATPRRPGRYWAGRPRRCTVRSGSKRPRLITRWLETRRTRARSPRGSVRCGQGRLPNNGVLIVSKVWGGNGFARNDNVHVKWPHLL